MILSKKKSKIHGYGLFAGQNIKRGTYIIEYRGQRITPLAAQVRERMYDNGPDYLFNLDERTVIDGGVAGNDSKYINHSCDPNCLVMVKDKRILFYARKDIEKGEELTFDYRYNKDSIIQYCNCSCEKCRGTINLK